MKLLITSDIHGHKERLRDVIIKHPDIQHHINAGDMCLPIHLFEQDVISVKGNNDFFLDLPNARLLAIEQLNIWLTHGHLERVKMGMDTLVSKAVNHQVDLCVFGHTHQRYLNVIHGIIFINPGALGDAQKSYAIYEDGQVSFHQLDDPL